MKVVKSAAHYTETIHLGTDSEAVTKAFIESISVVYNSLRKNPKTGDIAEFG